MYRIIKAGVCMCMYVHVCVCTYTYVHNMYAYMGIRYQSASNVMSPIPGSVLKAMNMACLSMA